MNYIIFIPVYTIVVALLVYLGYYIGRKSRSEDIDYICSILTQNDSKKLKVPKPRKTFMSIMDDLPPMNLDPVTPTEEPYKKKREGSE